MKTGQINGCRFAASMALGILLLLFVWQPNRILAQPHHSAFDLAGLQQEQALLPWMGYLPDPQRQLSKHSVVNVKDWHPLTVNRLGYLYYPVWTCLRLTNSSRHTIEAVLFNQRPMVQSIDITIWRAGRLIQQHQIGFSRPHSDQDAIISRLSNLVVHLPAGQTWTIFTRLETQGMLEAGWYAATVNRFTRQNYVALLILGLYCGIMLALIVHGIVSWASLGLAQFGFLVGYALCFMVYLSLINGITAIVNPGLPPGFYFISTIICLFAAFLFWMAFTQYFLNTRQTLPKIHRCLNLFKILFAIGSLNYLCAPWIQNANTFLPAWIALSLMIYVLVPLAGMIAVQQRLPHAWFYFLGHAVVFTLSGLLAALMQSNFIDDLYPLLLVQPWIVIIHVTVMALSLGMLTKSAQADLAHERQLVLEQSRFAAVGKTIGMIVHQWRAPLARLGAQFTELHAYVRHADPSPDQAALIREELLPGMQRSMRMMKDTVDDFSDFFSARRSAEHFDLAQVVDQVLEMISGRCLALGIEMAWNRPSQPLTLFGRPSTLAHVVMVLLGNALDMLVEREVKAPRVTLELQGDEQRIVMTVIDNAGGIDVQPLERVFDTFLSGKGEKHMGFGLAIAKRLVEERLQGSIVAENVPGGGRFCLSLPRRQSDLNRSI